MIANIPPRIDSLADDQVRWLVRHQADVDALWLPWRLARDGDPAWPAAMERRKDYRDVGLRHVAAGTVAGRKAAERFVAELELSGWLNVTLLNGRRYVRLTEAAEPIIRQLAGTDQLVDGWSWYCRLLALAEFRQRGLCLEIEILSLPVILDGGDIGDPAATNYGGPEPFDLESVLLPWLCRGIIRSHSDSQSHVGYAATIKDYPKPELPAGLPEYSERWAGIYTEAFCAALRGRQQWQSSLQNHVVIPVACGAWA